MYYYLAPMEGITTYIYRNAYARYFGGIDKYFTSFVSDKNFVSDRELSAKSGVSRHKGTREIQDILPENNAGIVLVPQIMSNNAARFLAAADKIASYGYDTVNLNLGCPSGTVTAKKRGSGFLSVPDELDAFLYEIYEKCPLKISVKTRLGISELTEWDRLLSIYTKYPIDELIVHTRLQQEFYTGKTHPECYAGAVSFLQASGAQIPLCYNGDLVSAESVETVIDEISSCYSQLHGNPSDVCMNARDAAERNGSSALPVTSACPAKEAPEKTPRKEDKAACNAVGRIMIGRGIIQNPGLIRQLRFAQINVTDPTHRPGTHPDDTAPFRTDIDGAEDDYARYNESISPLDETRYGETLRAFHDEILDGYIKIMSGDSPTLFKMKDLWTYMSRNIPDSGKYLKKIRKANRLADYKAAVNELFRDCGVASV